MTDHETVDLDVLREALAKHDGLRSQRRTHLIQVMQDNHPIIAAAREFLRLMETGFVVPAAEGRNEEPYELGWCAAHQDVARRWPDGSWGCWWECVVEASGHHQPSDFRSVWEALVLAVLTRRES